MGNGADRTVLELVLSELDDGAPDARLTKGVPVPMQSVSEVAYRPTFV